MERHSGALVVLLVMNVADLACTVVMLSCGGREGNPILAQAWKHSLASFVLAKTVLASFGLYILWRLRHDDRARLPIYGCVAIYLVVMALHMKALSDL